MIASGPDSQAGEKAVLASFNAKLVKRVAKFERTNRGVRLLELLIDVLSSKRQLYGR